MADEQQEILVDPTEEATVDPKISSESAVETVIDDDEDTVETIDEEPADTSTTEPNANGDLDIPKMKVAELRSELKERGLDTKGNKSALAERLQEAVNAEALEGDEGEATDTGEDILEDVKEDDAPQEVAAEDEEIMEVEEQMKDEETKDDDKKDEGSKETEAEKKDDKMETEEDKKEEVVVAKEAEKKDDAMDTEEDDKKKDETKKEEEKKNEEEKKKEAEKKKEDEKKKEEAEVVEVVNPPPPELPKFWKAVKDNPGDFTGWTYLLQYVEQKNHLESVREAFSAFFERYPYCYGYWKKFADVERRLGNMNEAKEIFERGLKSIALSVDLWIHFVNFIGVMNDGKPDKIEKVREMYERAIDICGTEFRSDKLWDAYIKFETDNKEWQKVTGIYDRIFTVPTQLYSHHFDKFKEFVQKHHPKDIISLDEFIKFRLEVVAEKGPVEETEGPIEGGADDDAPPGCDEDAPPGCDDTSKNVDSKPITDEENKSIQQKIIAVRETVYKINEQEVSKRWSFEEGIRRPYFHAKALEKGQLKNWKEYLDFEITNGTHERVAVLFERCLIACALYEDYWIKYAKYMEGHKKEAVSEIYRRACTIHLMKKPNIHMHWAAFEEEQGNIDTSREVLAKLEENLPNLVMITLERINLERRHGNTENVTKLYEDHVKDSANGKISSFYSIRMARYLSKVLGNRDKAQTVIEAAVEKDKENIQLYLQLFDLELQKTPLDEDSILCLFDVVQELNFDTETKVRFSHRRLEFLLDFGTDAVKLHSAQEEHVKLLKVKEDEQKAAIAAASVAAAKKRPGEQSNNTTQPIKKARPDGNRPFHQQQPPTQTPNFPPPQQGYNYNQGQWGNFQPEKGAGIPGLDEVIVIDDIDEDKSNGDAAWAWVIDDEPDKPSSSSTKKAVSSRSSSSHGSHSRDSSSGRRRRSRSRSPVKRRRSRTPPSRRSPPHSRRSPAPSRRTPPSRHHSRSPPRRRSRSPPSKRSRSPPSKRSRSPVKSKAPSSLEKSSAKPTIAKVSSNVKTALPAPKKSGGETKNTWQGAAATLARLSSSTEPSTSTKSSKEVKSRSPIREEKEGVDMVEGFVHNMTPIKSGKNTKFFNAILQVSQKDYINMVCFSTEVHDLLMTMSKNRGKGALRFSGVTMNDSRKGSGGSDVTVNKRSKITNVTCKFYSTRPFWSFLANFCSIQSAEKHVSEGEHIHISVTVQSCNNRKEQNMVRGNEIDRKDFVVTDKSGSITLSTWGEYTDILQVGKTYMIGNVTVKFFKGVKCLNTNVRTSIMEGVWDRKKHEVDYSVVFPSVYPEGGGSSLESQKKGIISGGTPPSPSPRSSHPSPKPLVGSSYGSPYANPPGGSSYGSPLSNRESPRMQESGRVRGSEGRMHGGDSRMHGGDSRMHGGDSRMHGGDSRMYEGSPRMIGGDSRQPRDSRMSERDSRMYGGDPSMMSPPPRPYGGDSRMPERDVGAVRPIDPPPNPYQQNYQQGPWGNYQPPQQNYYSGQS